MPDIYKFEIFCTISGRFQSACTVAIAIGVDESAAREFRTADESLLAWEIRARLEEKKHPFGARPSHI
uniref:Uncharacterized protein n=1 Tax=Trichogramma kaykai TaxID=54128 RepID=A0ABD2X144_9HYME